MRVRALQAEGTCAMTNKQETQNVYEIQILTLTEKIKNEKEEQWGKKFLERVTNQLTKGLQTEISSLTIFLQHQATVGGF